MPDPYERLEKFDAVANAVTAALDALAVEVAGMQKRRGSELHDVGHVWEAVLAAIERHKPHRHRFTMLSSPPTCEVCGAKAGEDTDGG